MATVLGDDLTALGDDPSVRGDGGGAEGAGRVWAVATGQSAGTAARAGAGALGGRARASVTGVAVIAGQARLVGRGWIGSAGRRANRAGSALLSRGTAASGSLPNRPPSVGPYSTTGVILVGTARGQLATPTAEARLGACPVGYGEVRYEWTGVARRREAELEPV